MKIRIFNLNIKIGFLFFASATFFLSIGMANNYLCCMIFSFLHEAGHLLAMKAMGCNINEISLGGMGIKIEKADSKLSYYQECIVALCGPLINLILMIILLYFRNINNFFQTAYNINLGLLIINLLPTAMFDGGRFLKYFLLIITSEENTYKILNIVGIFLSVALVAVLGVSFWIDIVSDYFIFFVICIVGMTVFNLLKKT